MKKFASTINNMLIVIDGLNESKNYKRNMSKNLLVSFDNYFSTFEFPMNVEKDLVKIFDEVLHQPRHPSNTTQQPTHPSLLSKFVGLFGWSLTKKTAVNKIDRFTILSERKSNLVDQVRKIHWAIKIQSPFSVDNHKLAIRLKAQVKSIDISANNAESIISLAEIFAAMLRNYAEGSEGSEVDKSEKISRKKSALLIKCEALQSYWEGSGDESSKNIIKHLSPIIENLNKLNDYDENAQIKLAILENSYKVVWTALNLTPQELKDFPISFDDEPEPNEYKSIQSAQDAKPTRIAPENL